MIGSEWILLVFYLVLLVRWQYVKRPIWFLIGVLGMLIILFGQFFTIGAVPALCAVARVFEVIGSILAFLSGVIACYGSELPLKELHLGNKPAGPTPPQA